MECPNCQAIMYYDGEMWECLECGETFVEEEEISEDESAFDFHYYPGEGPFNETLS